jgi:hypothetical protein
MFALRLGEQKDGPKTIDFTHSMWGHALHGSTFSVEPPHEGDDERTMCRYSVMVHSSEYPKVGDKIKFNAKSGIREDEIYEVDPCGDPDDMFILKCIQRQ